MKTIVGNGQADVLRVTQSHDETRAFYNKISSVYDLLAERSEYSVRKTGLEKLAVRPGEEILEVGFGTGHSIVQLARAVGPSGRVYGIDISQGMLEQASALLQREGITNVELRCEDAISLPYFANSVDGVFISFTLELFDNPEITQVLARCKRVLRPSGRIVVVSMSKDGSDDFLVHVLEWGHRHLGFLDCRPIHVKRALEDVGFVIVESQMEHMWVPVEIVLARK